MKHLILRRKPTIRLSIVGVVVLAVLLPVALLSADSFTGIARQWAEFFCLEDERCNVGDFNGDGLDDIIAFVRDDENGGQTGDVYVALSRSDTFGEQGNQWAEAFCLGNEICRVGDFNGDNNDDVAAFVRSSDAQREGDVYVSLSNGSSFGAQGDQWAEFFCIGNEVCATGDVNGDGLDDIISFVQDTQSGGQEGDVYVSLSDGSSFGAQGDQCAGLAMLMAMMMMILSRLYAAAKAATKRAMSMWRSRMVQTALARASCGTTSFVLAMKPAAWATSMVMPMTIFWPMCATRSRTRTVAMSM
jgi:hypothetical protein